MSWVKAGGGFRWGARIWSNLRGCGIGVWRRPLAPHGGRRRAPAEPDKGDVVEPNELGDHVLISPPMTYQVL